MSKLTAKPESNATAATKAKAEDKPKAPRKVNKHSAYGIFINVVRIEAQMSAEEWNKRLGMTTSSKYEMEGAALNAEYLTKVGKALNEIAPHKLPDFLSKFALPLGILPMELLTEDQKELISNVLNGSISYKEVPVAAIPFADVNAIGMQEDVGSDTP